MYSLVLKNVIKNKTYANPDKIVSISPPISQPNTNQNN